MKKITLYFIILIFSLTSIAAINNPNVKTVTQNSIINTNKVLAIVNNEPIFMSDLNSMLGQIVNKYKHSNIYLKTGSQDIKLLKKILLNNRINYILLKQEAKKRHIKVSEIEIKNYFNIIKKFFRNEQDFFCELKKENISIINLEQDIRDHLIILKLLNQVISNKMKVPAEKDIKNLYEKLKLKISGINMKITKEENIIISNLADTIKTMLGECVRLRQIFIKCNKNNSSVQNKNLQTKISNIKMELKKNNFSIVASKYSEDSISKVKNGDIGLITRRDLPYNVSKIVFDMKVGDYTKDPIKFGNGYYFIKVEEKHARRDFVYNEVKQYLVSFLYQIASKKIFNDYINTLRSKANIKINIKW
jgi:peptidyl-prolyl cis-trans isomerase SurA